MTWSFTGWDRPVLVPGTVLCMVFLPTPLVSDLPLPGEVGTRVMVALHGEDICLGPPAAPATLPKGALRIWERLPREKWALLLIAVVTSSPPCA